MMANKIVSSFMVLALVALVACAPQRRTPTTQKGKTPEAAKAAPAQQQQQQNNNNNGQLSNPTGNVPRVNGNAQGQNVQPGSTPAKPKITESIVGAQTSRTSEDNALIIELKDKSQKAENDIKIVLPADTTKAADLSKVEGLKSSAKSVVSVTCEENRGVQNTKVDTADCSELKIVLKVAASQSEEKLMTIQRSLKTDRKVVMSTPKAKLPDNRTPEIMGAALVENISISVVDSKDASKMEVPKQFMNIIVNASKLDAKEVEVKSKEGAAMTTNLLVKGLIVSVDETEVEYSLEKALTDGFTSNGSVIEFHLIAERKTNEAKSIFSGRKNVDILVHIELNAMSDGSFANVQNMQDKIKAEQKAWYDIFGLDSSLISTAQAGTLDSKAQLDAEIARRKQNMQDEH